MKTSKTTNRGGKAMTVDKLDKILRRLGFARVEEGFVPFGEDFYKIVSFDYDIEIEPNNEINKFGFLEHKGDEGVTKILEMAFSIDGSEVSYFVYVYRIIKFYMYAIHVFTWDDKYFYVYVWDKNELGVIARIELNGGYIIIGSQTDLDTLLPKLIKALDPHIIRIY
jgi:hypothetical protein